MNIYVRSIKTIPIEDYIDKLEEHHFHIFVSVAHKLSIFYFWRGMVLHKLSSFWFGVLEAGSLLERRCCT